MKLLMAAMMCATLSVAVAQDDTVPTIEQCRAYRAMWTRNNVIDKTEVNQQPYMTLHKRGTIFVQCSLVVVSQHQRATHEDVEEAQEYDATASLYFMTAGVRLMNYLQRHGEQQQFIDEDAAGKR